ncbi:MAG: LLM class flavin-dependent oxidoreductase [Actinomycetota bacterium]|nr:LLM class flavin-dependent oxidoreductase [Actinomycetota bacterium]
MLDQCPVPAGSSAADAVAASLALAAATERLGFHRYWVAEHHNTASLASVSPEILTAAIAATTSAIRVGSGGVLLPHYSPLKVAENFRLLDALYPGRIDLGVGRTAGTDPLTEAALQYRPGALGDEHFAQKVVDLLGFLDDDLAEGHPFAGVRAVPVGPGGPEVWILGSSSHGAACAAYLGLSFSFAHFITQAYGPQVMGAYRRGFTPSPRLQRPQASVAVSVICADTDSAAQRLATSVAVWHLRREGAERGPLLPPEDAARVPLSDLERARVEQHRAGMVVGAPERVRQQLLDLAAVFEVDELVVLTAAHDQEERLRSYELLAEAFARTWRVP